MLTPETALDAYRRHGTWTRAAEELRVDWRTVKSAARALDPSIPHDTRKRFQPAAAAPRPPIPPTAYDGIKRPEFPDSDLPIPEILDTKARLFDLKKARKKAERYAPVRVPEDGPFGLLVLGDPHLDDDGCDVRLMQHHLAIGRRPGVYTTSVGDMTNNWPHAGKLARLYASQSTDYRRGIRLLKWLIHESGVRWPFLCTGNHDDWNSGQEILREVVGGRFPVFDWDARVELRAGAPAQAGRPSGVDKSWRIHMAHNFPGHSMWHQLHAMLRASRFTTDAELLIAGHLHTESYMRFGLAGLDRYVHAVRVRGYKALDHYADRLGYQTDPDGASALVIMGHEHDENNAKFLVYHDIDVGYRVLEALRNSHTRTRHAGPRAPASEVRSAEPRARSATSAGGYRDAGLDAARDRPRGADRGREIDGGPRPRAPSRARGHSVRGADEADARNTRRAAKQPVRNASREGSTAGAARGKKRAPRAADARDRVGPRDDRARDLDRGLEARGKRARRHR
ncbi:MAG: hypothetical protein NW216_07650 [Hyphomicrobium sp.]|nr:hypothetical protein [Hyphomicrobium sp.]